jgi:YD repeat-containing protein
MKKGDRQLTIRDFAPVGWIILASMFSVLLPLTLKSQSLPVAPNLIPGQTATQLVDGRILLLGGERSGSGVDTASIWDPRTNITTQLSSRLNQGRAGHTATVLPDGSVLILGGVGNGDQIVATAEIFDPDLQTFINLPATGVTPRARHTATLLSDGHVLIAGGVTSNGQPVLSAELWDAVDPSAVTLPSLLTERRNHSATLLADGRVLLWGGADAVGNAINDGALFDPATGRFTPVSTFPSELMPLSTDSPSLVASIPLDRSVDIDVESIVSLRFSKPLRPETVSSSTVSLSGPKGLEKILVVPAESGSLAFLTPDEHLLPGATYTVTVNGAIDRDGLLLPVSGISFSTKPVPGAGQTSSTSSSSSSTSTIPKETPKTETQISDDDFVWRGKLKDGKPHSDWQDLPPLQAPPGETALAGQVLDLRGLPLAKVTLELESHYGASPVSVETDETGRFLLTGVSPGWGELIIDGHKAQRRLNEQSSALGPEEDHGLFEYGLRIKKGETLVLPFTIWLPKIDAQHAVSIPQKPSSEFVVTTPKIQGLELRLPANGELIDREGKPVREVSLTPIPLDRTPFPLPQVKVPVYFTAQPGGAYIHNPGGSGARVYYPNTFDELPGTRLNFWHYDAGYKGWYKYGLGTVAPDGKQIIPDPEISVYEFTGAMISSEGTGAPPDPPPPPCSPGDKKCKPGDPVDVATGLFIMEKTDLYLPDGTMPIALKRTYRQNDTYSRAFGIGTSHAYDLFFVGDVNPYTYIQLILPDGQKYRYDRISPGTSYIDAVYEHVTSRTKWYKSRISWNGTGWDLRLKDGTLYAFRDGFDATRPGQGGLLRIQDPNGNTTIIARDSAGNATRITASGGRWIALTYNVANRITQAQDNIGRTLTYEYDATGRLIKVTDPNGGTNEFTYDVSSRMLTVKDARSIVFLTNEYDATGKVTKQTMVDGGTYLFNYTMNGSNVIQTDVTDPRGIVSRRTFKPRRSYLDLYRCFRKA